MAKEFKFITISDDEAGSRLDRVLHKKYPYINKIRIEKALLAKLIMVNEQKSTSSYRVSFADCIKIAQDLIDDDYAPSKNKVSQEYVKLVIDNIIYRDADLIVINKPAGLAVQGGSKIKISIDDIIPQVLESFGTWSEGSPVHKLVHRLDKETSGILLIALNNRTAQELSFAFKDRQVDKKYLAILTGRVTVNNGQIASIIDREDRQIKENNAITNYKVLAKKPHASLIEFKPITGKTHQLRLHALELGFPILGDSKYDPSLQGVRNVNLHLHAAEINIPYQGSFLKLKADLPKYFQDSLKSIFNRVS
jgi:23S rRNA pseudouridine955/2504/2580 synthase